MEQLESLHEYRSSSTSVGFVFLRVGSNDCSRGTFIFFGCLEHKHFISIFLSVQIVAQWIMSKWVQLDNDKDKRSSTYYGLILGLTLGFAFVMYTGNRGYTQLTIKSSLAMHGDLLGCILKQPVAFFDTNPVGRILNRFSKGLSEVCLQINGFLIDVNHRHVHHGQCHSMDSFRFFCCQ
jgi:ABC-type multidrug transport system fused ATPase/permease subunit